MYWKTFIESNENVAKGHKLFHPELILFLMALILFALISFFVFFRLNYNLNFKENVFNLLGSVKKSLCCMKKVGLVVSRVLV